MTRKAALASAVLVVVFVGVPLAQPYIDENWGLTPISQGVNSTHTAAQELVITNDTDYANFFGGTPPSSPTVNFATEDVLAVTMGSQPVGSSINITGLDIRTTGFTAGFGSVIVDKNSASLTIPGGTSTNTGGTTQNTGGTTAVVGGTVSTIFVNGVPGFSIIGGATTITGGTTTTTGGTTTSNSSIYGTITNTGGTTTTTGDTTTTSAPVTIMGGSVIATLPLTIFNGTTTTSGVTTVGGTTTMAGGTFTGLGPTDSVQPYAVVKVAKGALAYAFVYGVTPTSNSGPTPFGALTYATGGGSAPFIEKITIDGAGSVTVNRSVGGAGGTTYVGTLTTAESLALNTAFVNADPASLPPTISTPAATSLTAIPSETLTSTIGSVQWTSVDSVTPFSGVATLVPTDTSTRFFQVVDAIRGPAERIVRGTLAQPFQGHVHYVGSVLKDGHSTIDPTDPFYGLIASAAGSAVAFDGLGKGRLPHVVDVLGKVTSDQPLLSFPSAGADVIVTIPAGTQLDVTNLTLSGNYFEVTSEGQRGFLLASAVSIVR